MYFHRFLRQLFNFYIYFRRHIPVIIFSYLLFKPKEIPQISYSNLNLGLGKHLLEK